MEKTKSTKKSVKKVMLINAQHPEECRAVILKDNCIDDYIVEHSSREQIKGNVYLGVIHRIEPSIAAAFVYFGYGFEFFMLYFIPSRIGLGLTGFVFVFLPHHPADISAHDDKYKASTVRQGWEWLLTPLMAFHNYHLINHVFPNVPFYNYLKIWHLQYDEITSKEPALQSAFGLKPVNR